MTNTQGYGDGVGVGARWRRSRDAVPVRRIEDAVLRAADLGLGGRDVLFVASTGGHLYQAGRWMDHLEVGPGSAVATFESPQSAALAERHRVIHLPYAAPRDTRTLVRIAARMPAILRERRYEAVVSTGAGVALSSLPLARLSGARAIFIESFSRIDGPSASGRILARIPGIERYTPRPGWEGDRWRVIAHPFLSRGVVRPTSERPPGQRPYVFVTLGTIAPYRFDRLVDAVLAACPPTHDIVWQLGSTTRPDLDPERAHVTVAPPTFERLAEGASVVISHAGVGTAMQLVELGVPMILVPRRRGFAEHVDDHQAQIAEQLHREGVAVMREAGEISAADFDGADARLAS